jgi:hypothetical protein
MWIRSQSKKALLNVNQVVINNTKDESEYYIHGYSERGIDILGVYSTEEKALEVLDYIQSEIQSNVYDEQTVLEMPNDEDF